ncbi:zinc metalloproteinase nas-13-like isoform X2 [Planococcus citri]|uniref:zinc metalloproteinase nas-13-like isoform X2 n=1 Tax=Planococcus citri TaxID=170843 RepID=UPI0031F89B3A
MSYLCLILLFVSAYSLPVSFDESENEIDNPDYDTFQNLQQLGDKLFGDPKNSSGDHVAKWTPNSGVFPEELGEYAEGDILHPISFTRNGLKAKSSRWTNKVIPYEISPYIRGNDRQMIYDSIEEYHKVTCLKFKERSSNDKDYVYFTNSNTGCWSSVGKIGGRQEINLQTPGCTTKKGTVMHEMLHAVGFMHEQNRPDRDKFVTINYNNIERGKESNFEKAEVETIDNQGIGYDYRSVMHYSGNAFSRNGLPTIEPKVRGTVLGQRDGLSKKDVQKIQKMYKCNKKKRPSSSSDD